MALRLARNAIYHALNDTLLENLDGTGVGFSWTAVSPWSREAMRAWVEKREPNFENLV